ncbi:hypothetical protein [Sphingomonas corticis]|uniref:Uncharacterized protein n=1 Tax=Sphingomonas corticis TaxID=2722791 RepID=A0ABX1CMN2_9SPHN|nr:hypothetical protein [Sphingomonas corticis]NJR78699.1 hypothetical protein [Sphingomonas corticis]
MNRIAIVPLAAFALAIAAASPAAARDVQVKAIRDVLDCQKVTETSARLTCFERAASALARATGEGEVVVLDREAVRKTRRDLFGFSVSTAELFDKGNGKDGKPEELDEITSSVTAVTLKRDGGYILSLAEGGRWEQISAGSFGRAPRPGMTAVVRKAAFGSFKMKVGEAPAIKVRRIN